ncbi:MAG: hypothetical protein QOD28_3490 [Acidobacteriota bacterium]|nr:hypothetical protein [Acidobacteriota bacterium]
MITGFNTDIEFDGVVYHVQTEDKGVDTPLILSLVYVGGAILASKRSHYHDLINAGFDPLVLTERLQRQHTLICAAVKAGRIEDLKRLSPPAADEPAAAPKPPTQIPPAAKAPAKGREAVPAPTVAAAETNAAKAAAADTNASKATAADAGAAKFQPAEDESDILALEDEPAEFVPPALSRPQPPAKQTPAPVRPSPVVKQEDDFIQVEAEGALHLSLMEEREFHAGEVVTIRVRVSRGVGDGRLAASNVPVTVKILGTEFRPLILTTRSDHDGVATIHAWLPRFTKGRAAVLVRATLDGFTAELRRVIHQP